MTKPGPASGCPVKRFWSKVDKTGECWTWTAGRKNDGYGKFWAPMSGHVAAHRFSYELANGPIPDGLHVCHHCDNPPCVNPAHLFLGSNLDNVRDKQRKGRCIGISTPGENNGAAKLTEDQVREIRNHYASGGSTQRSISLQFGIAQSLVSLIVNRKIWSHI